MFFASFTASADGIHSARFVDILGKPRSQEIPKKKNETDCQFRKRIHRIGSVLCEV